MGNILWLWITLGSSALIGLSILVCYIFIINNFKLLQKQIKVSMLDIDESILGKYDLLTQTVELTKRKLTDYAKEIGLMAEIPNVAASDTLIRKQELSKIVSEAMQGIYNQLEQQPELKQTKEIELILNRWIVMEESLETVRKIYNDNVSQFNHKIATFPFIIVAKLNNLKRVDFFEADIIISKKQADGLDT